MSLRRLSCFCGGLVFGLESVTMVKNVVCPECETRLVPRDVPATVNRTPSQIPREYFKTKGEMPFEP